ncbi:phosphatidylinositol N-acetylglucosaminyltransferase subunit H, putative [Plasmodium vinckei brucechwatti]|uniref:Phosphatidylinositol N-acetylglucosaminyltransferase subunit H, putative n=1 Tax=Plasmodium vinckei brucechwatti TaxID=119398 RepID=A0A6V7S534_PLAVN|nr:phosphatidylinositol N-acetylglucosaminyltransferase subunit H, putative [Plasmodium vinckei brucechwatti]
MNNELRKIVHTYGIEYICEKREKKHIVLYIIVTFSLYYIYYLYLGYIKGILIINELQIFIFCFYILLIITYLNNYSIVCPNLCIVLKNTKSLVLFEDYRLGIKNLVMIYRDMKSVVLGEHNLGLKNIKAVDVEEKNDNIVRENDKTYKEQNIIDEENSSSSSNTCSSNNSYVNSDNIYKFIQSNCFENCIIKNKINKNNITKTFDVHISKKLALEIMNS